MIPASKEFMKVCLNCGAWFKPKKRSTRYCSHTCNRRHYKALARGRRAAGSFSDETDQNQLRSSIPDLNDKEFLSVAETCSLLGISRRTLYRMINGCQLRIKKIGARTIILHTDINSLFQNL